MTSSHRFKSIFLLITLYIAVGLIACGDDESPIVDDVGHDVEHDAEGDAEPEEDVEELIPIGESCIDCMGMPSSNNICDQCESGWCYSPHYSEHEPYCTRLCDTEADCADLGWELCQISTCIDEDRY